MSPGDSAPSTGAEGAPSLLRLGALLGAAPDRWVARWHQRHPDIRLQLDYFEETGQLERIRSGAVDIGYLRVRADEGPVVDTEVFHRVWLYREDAVVCAAAEHWIAAAEDAVTWEDVAEETFLDPAEVAAWSPPSDTRAAERQSMEVVASGAGLLVLPRSVARALARKDVVIRGLEGHPGFDVGLCWLRERDDEVIQEFIGVTRGRRAESTRSTMDNAGDRSRGQGRGATAGGTAKAGKPAGQQAPRSQRGRPGRGGPSSRSRPTGKSRPMGKSRRRR